jgi:predicted ATPase/DNA-binding winged helix-turn-helix (wHTH) protein
MRMAESRQFRFYEFGPYRLDVVDRLLRRDDSVVPLNLKTFEVLLALVENDGHVMTKEALLSSVWPETFVEEGNLTKAIFVLRNSLGRKPDGTPYIETFPKRGYRFVTEVRRIPDESREPLVPASNRTNSQLPAHRNSFIGREQDIESVKRRLLLENVRLLTLTGAGGSGKTRLAIHVASELVNDFPGGIHYVPLSSLTDPRTVGPAIGHSFGFGNVGGKLLADILREHFALTVQAPTLLLLDNFEHLLPAAPLGVELLDACPLLKIVVTSRIVLHLYGEHEYVVPPLQTPDPQRLPCLELLSRNPAVALFLSRVSAVKPSFELTNDNASAIAEICYRLDGLPLAIELAAARMKAQTTADLLGKLQSRLDLLVGGARDLPSRQQTLRKTIDWSFGLLSIPLQRLFRRLSVFAGGCTLEGVEAVCNAYGDLEIDALEGMTALLDHNFVQQTNDRERPTRFTMLQTLREYGLERLRLSGEEECTRRAHAAYCLVVAEEGSTTQSGGEREIWLDLCETEHDNFSAALHWLLDSQNAEWALRLGLALFTFWEAKEYLLEGRESLRLILQLPGASSRSKARADVLWRAGALMGFQDIEPSLALHKEALEIYTELGNKSDIAFELNGIGACEMLRADFGEAKSWYERALEVCRELGSEAEIAGAMSNLAQALNAQGDRTRARSLLEEALSIFRRLGLPSEVAWSLNHLGDIALSCGRLSEARSLYQEGADVFCKHGDVWGIARSLNDLAHVAGEEGDPSLAEVLLKQSLQLFLSLGHKRGVAKTLEGLAWVAAKQGHSNRALVLGGFATALRRRIGAFIRPAEQGYVNVVLELLSQTDDRTAAEASWSLGWKMPLEDAVQYAMSEAS